MEFFDVVKARRSVRTLTGKHIPMEDLEKIVDAGRRAPSGKNVQPCEYLIVTKKETIRQLGQVQSFIQDAPAVIAVITDPEMSKYWLEDASAAVENMLLAVTALGYGSCWVEGTLLPKEDWTKELLGIPKDKRLVILIPIGEPVEEGEQAVKKGLKQVLHYEKYRPKNG